MNYEQELLERVDAAVQSGLPVRQAVEKFSGPRAAICDRVSGKQSPALPSNIETKIVNNIKMAAKLGVGLCRKHIFNLTNVLCMHVNGWVFQQGTPNSMLVKIGSKVI